MGDGNESPPPPISTDPLPVPEPQKDPEEVVIVSDEDEEADSSDCEIISVTSATDEQEMKWRNLSRLNTLISEGYDNPRLLLTRIFGMSPSILPSDSASLWSILFSVLSEQPHRRRLKQFATLDSVVKLLRDRSRILVLTGAGISVSCGIPDFRSRDGVYARLARDYPDLKSPQNMFDMEFFMKNPYPFFKFARELFPGQFKPSFAHRFIKLLERKGKLLRNYTQNIDTLEQAAGITRVIQCHGSFATASCVTCQYQVPGEAVREAIMSQRVPRCPRCCPDQGLSGSPVPTTPTSSPAASTTFGIMKPDIVFFGEGLPYEFHTSLQEDVHQADLILVMGSSLKVRPVSHIPDSVVPEVPQILVNRESLPKHNFDTELLGDCDVILEDLCGRLGWNLDEDTDSASSPPKNTELLSEKDLHLVLAAALSDRFANDESLEAVASCSTIATACPGGIGDEKSPTSEGLDDSVTLVPPATEPTQCQGGDKASKTEQIAEKRKKKARNSSPANPGLFTSEEVNANGSSPPIAADNAAPQQEPRDVGKSAESTINVDDESSEDSDSDESSAFADYKMVFNLADYLPERGYTKVPPNQYVFKGAELPFEYEMAEDLLRSQGAISLLEESTSLASSPSTSSTTSCDQPSTGDVFMRHLLRRCAMDQELQRHREARRNGEVGDLEVIDCDLSSSPSSCGEAKTAEKPATTKASSAHQTEEEADALQPTTSTPPLTKRRRCSSEVAGDEDGDAAATAAASSTGKTVDV